MKTALTIAGSDPSGGAGIQADLKTFHAHRVYGTSVVTLVTAQNTRGVSRVNVLSEDLVVEQLRAVLLDVPPAAVKTGALGNVVIVEAVARHLEGASFPLVVDPVMISKHGDRLIDDAAQTALVKRLIPMATLVTPNAHEASVLAGMLVENLDQAEEAVCRIARLGPKAVLVKGARFGGVEATDVLWLDGKVQRMSSPFVDTPHTHGTGCTLSAAITAWLAQGVPLVESVQRAKDWLSEALLTAPSIGSGIGPVNHFAPVTANA